MYARLTADGIVPDSTLWCHLITAAGTAGDADLAHQMYQHAVADTSELSAARARNSKGRFSTLHKPKGKGSRHHGQAAAAADSSTPRSDQYYLVNPLLQAYGQVGNLRKALKVYHEELLARDITPDEYTIVALLTAASRHVKQVTLAELEYIRGEWEKYGMCLNTQVGSAMINAYRRVLSCGGAASAARMLGSSDNDSGSDRDSDYPNSSTALLRHDAVQRVAQLSRSSLSGGGEHTARKARASNALATEPYRDPDLSDEAVALSRAEEVFQQLKAGKMASAASYTVLIAFYIEQGRLQAAHTLFKELETSGLVMEPVVFDVLARAAEDWGHADLATHFRHRSRLLMYQQAHPLQRAGPAKDVRLKRKKHTRQLPKLLVNV